MAFTYYSTMNTNQWADMLSHDGAPKLANNVLDNDGAAVHIPQDCVSYREPKVGMEDEDEAEDAESFPAQPVNTNFYRPNKRPIEDISASDIFCEERPRKRVATPELVTSAYVASATLENIPACVRLHMLSYLEPGSLAKFGFVSKTCHEESKDETLPAHTDPTFQMNVKPGELMVDFLPRLVATCHTIHRSYKNLALHGVDNLILREVVWDDIRPTKEQWASLGIDHRSSDDEARDASLMSEEQMEKTLRSRSTRRHLKKVMLERAPALQAIIAALNNSRARVTAGNQALEAWFKVFFLQTDIVVIAPGLGAVKQFKGDARKQRGPSRRPTRTC